MPACRLLDGRPEPLVLAKGGQWSLLVLGVAQLALHGCLDVLKHDTEPLLTDHRPDLAWEEHLWGKGAVVSTCMSPIGRSGPGGAPPSVRAPEEGGNQTQSDQVREEHLLVYERVRVVLRDPSRTESVQLLQHQHEEVPLR